MSKLPKVVPVDYINYYTGELLEVIGEGIHTKTRESIVIVRNEKKMFFSIPKSTFMLLAIEDASAFNRISPEISFKIKNMTDDKLKVCLVFGQGMDIANREKLVYYTDLHSNYFASPLSDFSITNTC